MPFISFLPSKPNSNKLLYNHHFPHKPTSQVSRSSQYKYNDTTICTFRTQSFFLWKVYYTYNTTLLFNANTQTKTSCFYNFVFYYFYNLIPQPS